MKKSLVALAVLSAIPVATAAPVENSFYVGTKAGWASFHDGVNQLDSAKNNGRGFSINRNYMTLGAFTGYQINKYFATELGYDYFGVNRGYSDVRGLKTTFKHRVQGAHITLKASYPIAKDFDIYAKLGTALTHNSYKVSNKRLNIKENKYRASMLVGAGLEYAITPKLAARVEYQWLNNAGKASLNTLKGLSNGGSRVKSYSPDIASVTFGLTYRFGQKAKPTTATIIKKNFAFSSDVLFDFGKAKLRPNAKNLLDKASTDIKALGLAKHTLQVNGHTDRLGKAKANQKLSQRRADNVAKYLVTKGQNPDKIVAVGYGSTNPITGKACDSVKGRKALINCLAPDRRVEVHVQGSKKISIISNK